MLEIMMLRTIESQVLKAIRDAAGVRSLAKQETDGDEEEIGYAIYELPEDKQVDIEIALLKFSDDIRFGWH